jgi:glycosyltransferase involved in cell wall biosynthesis
MFQAKPLLFYIKLSGPGQNIHNLGAWIIFMVKRPFPRVLNIETGLANPESASPLWAGQIDYEVYAHYPRWRRWLEEKLRLDVQLARDALQVAEGYDVLWAWSEKVGIPLALMAPDKPLFVVGQHLSSPAKRGWLRRFGLLKRWSAIGYLCEADRLFLVNYFGCSPDRLVQALAAPIDRFSPEYRTGGPLISLGVSKRDYPTLLKALIRLPECQADIYANSRYGDPGREVVGTGQGAAIRWQPFIPDASLPEVYAEARFVVLTMQDSTQFAAGLSVALEAAAAGKAIIVTANTGMRSLFEHEQTALLVPPADAVALEHSIRRLWHSPELCHRLGQAARRHVERHFNPGLIQAGLKAKLAEIAG